jgi:hypothetical protein
LNNSTFSTSLLCSITMSACLLLPWQNAQAATNERTENNRSSKILNQTPTIDSAGTTFFCSGESLTITSSLAETYQWYKDGQPILGATGQTYDVNQNGYYKVAVTYGEGPGGVSAELHVRQANTWTGAAGDDNWYTPANWSCGVVPSANDHVEVVDTGITFPTVSNESILTVYSLKINDDARLEVTSGSTLEVTDAIEVAESASLILHDEASLLQTNDVNNIGNITAQKNTTPMKRYDFTYWSSPVAGQTLHDLSPNTLADKYYSFSPTIGNWVTHLNGAQVMEEAKGYIVRAPQDFSMTLATTYNAEFIGTPNNGTIQIPIVIGSSDMNLIGNPYPSAIDMDAFLLDPNNAAITEGTIYLWTHNSAPAVIPGDNTYNYTSNDYAVYNLLGGIETSTIGNNEKPTGKVASGQCFFIKGLSQGQVVFDNSMRVAFSNDQFFRSNSEEKHRLWLNLSNNQGAFKQALLGYIHGATDGLDRNYDGATFNANAYVDFYTLLDDKHLAIQGRALPFDQNTAIPLGYSTTVPGTFTISIDTLDGLFESQDVFLYDSDLDLTYDLKQFGAYMFGTSMGTFNNRFELRFVNSTLATADFDQVAVAADQEKLQLKASSAMAAVRIFDLSGRMVYERNGIGSDAITLTDVKHNHSVLFVKITLENGKTFVRKIMM